MSDLRTKRAVGPRQVGAFTKNVCYRSHSKSMLIGDTMWLYSGYYTDDKDQTDINSWMMTEGVVQSIDLSSSWSAQNVQISQRAIDIPVMLENGAIFPSKDGKKIVIHGGGISNQNFPSPPPQGSYSPLLDLTTGKSKNMTLSPNNADTPELFRTDGAIFANLDGVGYALGGQQGPRDDARWFNASANYNDTGMDSYWVKGMQILNLDLESSDTTIKISNTTAQIRNFDSKGWGSAINGAMVTIPNVGGKGILVPIGGQAAGPGVDWNDAQYEWRSMEEVAVYDIASNKWFRQTSNGEIPAQRTLLCAVAVSAVDSSSHEIFMYGGVVGSSYTDEVYVLTLPAFTWKKIYSGSSSAMWSTCQVGRNRQMVVVGNGDSALCGTQGIRIFDLTSYSWSTDFDSDAARYERNKQVTDITGGDFLGNSTIKKPVLGWSDPGLASVFALPATTSGSPSSSPTASTTSSPTSSNSSSPAGPGPKSKTGPIVGGVVGGIAILALLAGLLFFFMRRRNPKKEPWRPVVPVELNARKEETSGHYAPLGSAQGSGYSHEMPGDVGERVHPAPGPVHEMDAGAWKYT